MTPKHERLMRESYDFSIAVREQCDKLFKEVIKHITRNADGSYRVELSNCYYSSWDGYHLRGNGDWYVPIDDFFEAAQRFGIIDADRFETLKRYD